MNYLPAFKMFIVWEVWASYVKAEEMTKDFDCCEKIPVNRSHVNEFFVEYQTMAIITPSKAVAHSPFQLNGEDLMLVKCVNFSQKTVYYNENFTKEDFIHFISQPCDDKTALVIGLPIDLALLTLLVAATEANIEKMTIKLRENAILPCTANPKPAVEYRDVRWYKEGVSPRLTGLLSKELPDGRMRWYVGASTQNSVLNHTLNLLLPNVSCSHTGVYQCYLSAPVGEQNREGRVRLTVTDCPPEPEVEVQQIPLKAPESPVGCVDHRQMVVMVVMGAGVVMVLTLGIALIYRRHNNRLWLKTKTLERELNSQPHHLPEKQGLVHPPICIVAPDIEKARV